MSDDGDVVMLRWAIYERPKEYPAGYVVRRQRVFSGGVTVTDREPVLKTHSLLRARAIIPTAEGLVCMAKNPAEPPHVLEVWT